ncbi:MAG: NADH-quinone oxidoreductase subunit N [Caldilinea sp.]|uniref:NADH-quinone oxidoreductase subunit N n=1 Tax=Caldilinea sp. TaxID=2293560 RepID=UPI002C3F337D|nr:NADH-quinone oxidoreductase subunit N [Caldilinea sp.]
MEIGFASLTPILPELLVAFGALLILILDTASPQGGSNRGYMAITAIFLLLGLAGAFVQLGGEPQTALYVVDIDAFSLFLKMIVYTAMLLTTLAGGGYLNQRVSGGAEFWSSYLFISVAMAFAVSANNLLMIFVAIEFLSITSYILVGSIREDLRSSEAGLKYFLYGSVASAIMLYGMTFMYGATGSLNLVEIGTAFAENRDIHAAVIPSILLVMAGLGFKTSLAPFFQWTPDVYEGAPTPVTAYLSTASKAAGFAVMARVLLIAFAPSAELWVPILGGLSVLTMFAGNLMALRQTNIKRMFAYSSVAQAGYILLGLASVVDPSVVDVTALSMNGLNGMLIYLMGYLFTNIGVFMVVMAVENMTGGSDYANFSGLIKRAPWLASAMFIFLLSLVGIPLTAGFVGKFFVFGATIQHQYYFLALMAVINVAISAFYYMSVARIMFFPETDSEEAPIVGAPGIGAQVIVTICVAGVFWIGLYPPLIIEWANTASQFLLTIL